jgi:hypothetical protein
VTFPSDPDGEFFGFKVGLGDDGGASGSVSIDSVYVYPATAAVPITKIETDAGITSIDTRFPPGDIRRSKPVSDGSTDDAEELQNAFNGSFTRLVFPEGGTFAFESQLTISAGLDVDFNHSTLRKTVSDVGDTFQIDVGIGAVIRNLTLEVPAGITILRGINLNDRAEAYNVKVTSADQQNNLGSAERAAFNVNGDDTIVDYLRVENFDKSVRFEDAVRGWWSNIFVTSYATGIDVHTCSYFTIDNYICHTKSPNASVAAGHNGIVIENPNHGRISNYDIADSGEHGIYHSVGAGITSEYVSYSNGHIARPGQSGFKMSGESGSTHAQHVGIHGLEVVDCSTGNAAGATEHALMIEYSDHVKVTGFSTYRVDDADHAFNGIFIAGSTDISIPAPVIKNVADSGIIITDRGVAETCEDIYIPSPVILGPGGDGIEIDFDTTGSVLRNIIITDAYIAAPGGFGVNVDTLDANILQPIIITGHVRSATSGVYNNANGNADVLLNVRGIEDAERAEIATGTFTASVYNEHTIIESSGGSVTVTLPDGVKVGQEKTFTMSNATNPSTVSVTNHETSDPEVFTFAQTSDVLVLKWNNLQWVTISNIGATT